MEKIGFGDRFANGPAKWLGVRSVGNRQPDLFQPLRRGVRGNCRFIGASAPT